MSRQLPDGFVEMLRSYGRDELVTPLINALADTEPSVAVRVNSRRGATFDISGTPIPWLSGRGMYLDKRPNFALDPAWHQGLYYVQDASSMAMTAVVAQLVAEIFDNRPLRYLDACAAPGGKSIAAAEALPDGSILVSNEYDRHRAAVMAENVAKYGMAAVAVAHGDTSRIARLGEVFDIVAVDAPCSGEGMMRKEPEAIAQWSPGLVADCAALQRKILADCWQALAPGGVIIYSTCTFNRTEDEENLGYIINELGGEGIELSLKDYPGVAGGFDASAPCYRFMPGLVRGEGLFIAAVRKPAGRRADFKVKPVKQPKAPDAEKFMRQVLVNADNFVLRQAKSGAFYAVPSSDCAFFDYLAERLQLISCGISLCNVKGRDLAPAWQLAFNEQFAASSMPSIPLGREAALRYLHGESLASVPDGLPKGFATVTYDGEPLGFVKNIGRRANNLYPDALRLRLDPAKGIDNDYQRIVATHTAL